MDALQNTVLADVSLAQAPLRAAERLRAELTSRFGEPLTSQLLDRALSHESVRASRAPLCELRALIAAEILNRVGEVLVATAEAIDAEHEQWVVPPAPERDADRPYTATREPKDIGRTTHPETPAALDRSEVRRALG